VIAMSPKTYRSAQYYYVPDTRPTGPAQMRTADPKRPGGQDAGTPRRHTRRPSGKAPNR